MMKPHKIFQKSYFLHHESGIEKPIGTGELQSPLKSTENVLRLFQKE